jgi:uncharacterized DUF497 family protein
MAKIGDVMVFRWNEANTEHIGKHDLTREDAEYVVRRARRPYPEKRENGKYYVAGQTEDGSYIQVVFIINPAPRIYVIHARRLNEHEKRLYRRRIR